MGRLLISICLGGAYIALPRIIGGTVSCAAPSCGALLERSRSGGRPGIVAIDASQSWSVGRWRGKGSYGNPW